MSSQAALVPQGMFSKPMASQLSSSTAGVTAGWMIITWVGFTLAVVGWSDILMGLYPAQFGNPDWEFGTISRTFDSLPLGTIGLGVAMAAAMARARHTQIKILAGFCALIVLVLVVLTGMYALSVPVILNAAPPQMRWQVNLALVKTSLFAVTYTVLYVALSRAGLRAGRTRADSRSK